MLSPRVRSILLVAVLLLVLPVASEAAGLWAASPEQSVMTVVWAWLSEMWSGRAVQLDSPSGMTLLDKADSSGTTTTGTPTSSGTSGSATCGGDQGACIDPNG
jgi:hypothetical protein